MLVKSQSFTITLTSNIEKIAKTNKTRDMWNLYFILISGIMLTMHTIGLKCFIISFVSKTFARNNVC